MTRLLLAVACSAPQLAAQAAAQDLTFQVSPAQLWTDTGLDLQSGDVVQISASAASASGTPPCDPAGMKTSAGQTGDQISGLPLSTAPAGALLARLHQQGAAPVLVGASTELRITESSHLFLGMNLPGTNTGTCGFAVKVHKSSGSTSSTTDATQPQDRKAQLRSQLSTAAQIFMSGQFGAGKADSPTSSSNVVSSSGGASGGDAATAAPLLKLSDAPLDSALRRNLDNLPRRVNDQFQNLGDMVNFVIVGNEKDVQAALDAATWHVADTDNKKAVLNALMETYGNKDYLAMPMSTLYLFGRKQDFGYEMAEPIAMVASRHHFRIWKTDFTWNGKEVWVGAGTHDIGFAKDKRNGNVTHKIDPMVDGERDNIGNSLQKANKTKTLTYYLPPNPVQDARNATGDGYQSDGRLLVIVLQ